ncbi:membrane dipeptidase [candidate division KSB1 bacterium]|nr:membrane dipeptidase [candidate division KSB1 bacterium]
MVSASLQDWRTIHYDAQIVDLHAHPSLKISLFNRILTSRFHASRSFDPFSVRTDYNRLKEGGVDVLLSTAYAPEKGILQECQYIKALRYLMPRKWQKIYGRSPFDVTVEMLDIMEESVANSIDVKTGKPMAHMALSVTELNDLLARQKDHPIAVVHNIEGAHSLDGKIDNLELFFQRGVAYLTLAHFYENDAVHPCFPYPESVQRAGCFQGIRNLAHGLKSFGENIIEKMLDLGMIIDITHCTPIARHRIFDMVGNRAPLLASHVGTYEVNPSPYNLRDDEIKKIADSGGAIAIIFMNYWLMPHETRRGLDFISRTIEHVVNVGGIDHVAIGSDFDGFTDPPDDLKDASQLPRLTQRLISDGYRVDDIRKVLGANALRVLRDGWRKK